MAVGIHAIASMALILGQNHDFVALHATKSVEALRKRAARERVRAKYLRNEELSIFQSVASLEQQILAKLEEMDQLQKEGERIDERLLTLREERSELRVKLARLRRRAGRRVAGMVRLKRSTWSRMLSEGADVIEDRRRRDRLRFVLGYDHSLLTAARKASVEAEKVEREFLRESTARVAGRAKIESQIKEIEQLREDREVLSEAIRSERETTERMMHELEEAAESLELEIGRIHGEQLPPPALPGGFSAQRGRLPWPTIGQIEVAFGRRIDFASEMVLVSKGIDIRAEQSENVRAVFGGRVMYAESFDGFGNLVILSHDGGYYTLYGHLESFAVRTGTDVAQHQVIGFVGDSGSVKGSYLYFEIRDGREAVDPLRWLNR